MHLRETIINHQPNGSDSGWFTGCMSSFNVFTHLDEWQRDNFEFPEDYYWDRGYDSEEDSDDEREMSDSDDEKEK